MVTRCKIFIINEGEDDINAIKDFLSPLNPQLFTATTSADCLKEIENVSPDVIILSMNPGDTDAYELCRKLRDNENTRLIPVIISSPLYEKIYKIKSFQAGANDFILKPFDRDELLVRVSSLVRTKILTEQMDNVENILYALVNIIDAKDSYTRGHSERVTSISCKLAQKLGVSEERISILEKAAQLHDIGKIGVPESILNKPGVLTPEEFDKIKQHPVLGEEMCKPLHSLAPLLPVIRHHHERYDGKGYPDGLQGEQIPLEARIIAVADSYDAMVSERPYRGKLPKDRIINIFKAGKNVQWDGRVVDILLQCIDAGEI